MKQALACDENQLTELLATAQKSVEEAQEAYDKAEQSGSSAKYLARSQLLKAQQLEEVAGKLLEDKRQEVRRLLMNIMVSLRRQKMR